MLFLHIFWNFELAHAGSEGVSKPRFKSRPGVECKLREDGIQSRRLSWLQASEGSSKLLRSIGFTDTMTCMVLESSIGRTAACWRACWPRDPHSCVPRSSQLRDYGVCRDGAQARGASRPASKFVDGSLGLAARVREVDVINSFLPSLLPLL